MAERETTVGPEEGIHGRPAARFVKTAKGFSSQVGANRVLIYQYLITLVGVAAGVLLLGESLTANKVLGGAVILLGVYLARKR